MTLAIFSAPFSRRQHFWASRPSLKTMTKVALRDPQPLVRSRTKPDGGKGRFNRVGGAQVGPVLSREVVESEEHLLVFLQAIARLWVFELIVAQEPIVGGQGVFAGRSQVHVMKHLLGPTLQAFG